MDAATFDAFYSASFPRLVGQVYAMCGDFAEAQDCVQEAFVRAWDRRRQIDGNRSPESWVRTVAWRLAVSRWRRARRTLAFADRSRPQPRTEEPDVEHAALVSALRKIPEVQRRTVVLHHLCDLPVAQVAAETGVSEGTVKARLSRGRAALAHLLGEDRAEEKDHA